tara:strand:+ start:11253 stop:11621 length:369 start_codon:yes stop_codon:yes gene_type:complete
MPLLVIGAVFGFLSVALGAFGAHGLEGRLTSEGEGWWQTATLYALVHSVMLAALGLAKAGGVGRLDGAGLAFAIGILIFSGSLYAMSLGAPRWFGAITPLGGVSLLIGWGWLGFRGLQLQSS